MPLQFHRAIETMEIWSAASEGYSFVISYESPTGPGLHGRAGYLASWRREAIYAAARSCLSSPRITIFITSSDNGPCNVFASSHGARVHTSRSSSGG
jgi:hypothetical protein